MTEEGKRQAREVGKQLNKEIAAEGRPAAIKFYVSPFKRTIQTWKEMQSQLVHPNILILGPRRRKELRLTEYTPKFRGMRKKFGMVPVYDWLAGLYFERKVRRPVEEVAAEMKRQLIDFPKRFHQTIAGKPGRDVHLVIVSHGGGSNIDALFEEITGAQLEKIGGVIKPAERVKIVFREGRRPMVYFRKKSFPLVA